jgi:hypothetical protein
MITIKAPANRGNFQQYDFGLITFKHPNTISATTTSGSTSVTCDATGLAVGLTVVGSNITAGTKIQSINSNPTTGFTLTANATGTGSTSLTFTTQSRNIDEIVLSDFTDNNLSDFSFIKRYFTWLIYTYTRGGNSIYNVTFLNFDRTNQIAYTSSDTIRIITLS